MLPKDIPLSQCQSTNFKLLDAHKCLPDDFPYYLTSINKATIRCEGAINENITAITWTDTFEEC